MSSTNRKNANERHISDYYVTPHKVIQDFLNVYQIDNKNLKILDPCAGGDINNPMSYPYVLLKNGFNNIQTIDIREDSLANKKIDFLEYSFQEKFDLIITNPPFNIALEIINKSFELLENNGHIIMLLRLNFLGSQSRIPFFKKHMPKEIYVHSKRISFINGQTDSIEYAHFVWNKEEIKHSKLFLI